jgi:hypothetical protein
LDALIHLDAEELDYVYEWRLEQEHELIKEKGTGMSDEAVRRFVDCCKFPLVAKGAVERDNWANSWQTCQRTNYISTNYDKVHSEERQVRASNSFVYY